jgi:hypothetical protein
MDRRIMKMELERGGMGWSGVEWSGVECVELAQNWSH